MVFSSVDVVKVQAEAVEPLHLELLLLIAAVVIVLRPGPRVENIDIQRVTALSHQNLAVPRPIGIEVPALDPLDLGKPSAFVEVRLQVEPFVGGDRVA